MELIDAIFEVCAWVMAGGDGCVTEVGKSFLGYSRRGNKTLTSEAHPLSVTPQLKVNVTAMWLSQVKAGERKSL